MKKSIIIIVVLMLVISCKDEVIKKPDRLIEKNVMVDIMYDLSILDAIKYQNPASLDTFKINPRTYIFSKYKIDSLQFAKNNVYYASDYEGYKVMFEEITNRLESTKKSADSLINLEKKKKKSTLQKNKKTTKVAADTTKLK